MLQLLKDTQNSTSSLAQCCDKSGKAMPGSGGQGWSRELATNIGSGSKGGSLTIFVTDCSQNIICNISNSLYAQKNFSEGIL